MPGLADQQELIFFSSVRTLNVVWRTYREQWIIGMDGGRERERHRERERARARERERERESGTPCCQSDLMMMMMVMMMMMMMKFLSPGEGKS